MRYSRYNYLRNSEKYGALLFNTRTKFFISLSSELFSKITELSILKDFEVDTLDLSPEILVQLINGKVFVGQNEDDDYYELKKFLRYKQAFAQIILASYWYPLSLVILDVLIVMKTICLKQQLQKKCLMQYIPLLKRKDKTVLICVGMEASL